MYCHISTYSILLGLLVSFGLASAFSKILIYNVILFIYSILLGLLVSLGLASALSLPYTPMHAILPFLCLGIGIDDMFVSMQCFNNLSPTDSQRSLKERFGLTMSRAGCAITVTSLTDFLAFAIGGTTVLPALQSFCLFCAVGLIVVYILQVKH